MRIPELLNDEYVIGSDEVGRGAWAGPIIAAAVLWPISFEISQNILIRDSKTMNESQRELSGVFLREKFVWSCHSVSPETIDLIGIQKANELCLKNAILKLCKKIRTKSIKILIDGRKIFTLRGHKFEFHIQGESKFPAIAAASILAKTKRDAIMRKLGNDYPLYLFDKHKGYGTRKHHILIEDHGVCKAHRMSFEPMKSMIGRIMNYEL